MFWTQKSHYCLESDAGYTVSKVFIRTEAKYLAWAPNQNYPQEQKRAHYSRFQPIPQPMHCLGRFDSASDAQSACEQHQQRSHP